MMVEIGVRAAPAKKPHMPTMMKLVGSSTRPHCWAARPTAPPTQSAYVLVDDCDRHHARAVSAGADVVKPPEDQDYGGRLYICRDLEGHVWSFGTYDPWALD